jgi:GNAT superfamily N-acetyltransferase
MKNFILKNIEISKDDGVITIKNMNTTLGFVRFNKKGEVEYIFVNPIFRKKGLAKKLVRLVKDKTGKKIVFQQPISPLGEKLIKSVAKWS